MWGIGPTGFDGKPTFSWTRTIHWACISIFSPSQKSQGEYASEPIRKVTDPCETSWFFAIIKFPPPKKKTHSPAAVTNKIAGDSIMGFWTTSLCPSRRWLLDVISYLPARLLYGMHVFPLYTTKQPSEYIPLRNPYKNTCQVPCQKFPDFFPLLEALPKMSKKERAHLDLVTWIYHLILLVLPEKRKHQHCTCCFKLHGFHIS